MPIKSLTGKEARFPMLGKIRKGEVKKGNAPGRDTDHFRLDCKIPEIVKKFQAIYGDKPKALDVLIPYPTIDTAFPCWMESYIQSGLNRRCDEETIQVSFNKAANRYDETPQPCLKNSATPCDCKPVGRLNLILPKIGEMGYFALETHSVYDISALNEHLLAIELSAGTLQGMPFLLERSNREVTVTINGQRSKQTKSLCSIRIHPERAARVLQAIEQRAMQAIAPQQLQQVQIQGATVLSLPSVDDSWKEKGIAWAIGEGVDPMVVQQLANASSSKAELFVKVKEYLEAQVASREEILEGDDF